MTSIPMTPETEARERLVRALADKNLPRLPWAVCSKPKNDLWHAGLTIGSVPDGTRIGDLSQLRHDEGNAAIAEFLAAVTDPALLALLSKPQGEGAEGWRDNPETDGTDAAHPAYWRGSDAGVEGACQRIEEALDGNPMGVCGSARLQKLRERVALLHAPKPQGEAGVDVIEGEGHRWVIPRGEAGVGEDAYWAAYVGSAETVKALSQSNRRLREALEGVIGLAENFLELHLMEKAAKNPAIIQARAALSEKP